MNPISILLWASLACALGLTAWTAWVWRVTARQPLFEPVDDIVSAHPMMRGHLVDPRSHGLDVPASYRLARRPSTGRVAVYLLVGLVPVTNLCVVAAALLVALWLLALVGWNLATTHGEPA